MDWGLLDKRAGENTFLREGIVYASKVSSRVRLTSGVFQYGIVIVVFIFLIISQDTCGLRAGGFEPDGSGDSRAT